MYEVKKYQSQSEKLHEILKNMIYTVFTVISIKQNSDNTFKRDRLLLQKSQKGIYNNGRV